MQTEIIQKTAQINARSFLRNGRLGCSREPRTSQGDQRRLLWASGAWAEIWKPLTGEEEHGEHSQQQETCVQNPYGLRGQSESMTQAPHGQDPCLLVSSLREWGGGSGWGISVWETGDNKFCIWKHHLGHRSQDGLDAYVCLMGERGRTSSGLD